MRSWFKTRIGRGDSQPDDLSAAAAAVAAGGFGAIDDLSTPRLDPRAAGSLRRAPSVRSMSLEKHFQGSMRDVKQLAEDLMDGESSVQTEDFLAVLETDDQSMASSALAFDDSKYAGEDDEDDDTESQGSGNSDMWKSKRATTLLQDLMESSDSSIDTDKGESFRENGTGEADESDQRIRSSPEDESLNNSEGTCDAAQSPAGSPSAIHCQAYDVAEVLVAAVRDEATTTPGTRVAIAVRDDEVALDGERDGAHADEHDGVNDNEGFESESFHHSIPGHCDLSCRDHESDGGSDNVGICPGLEPAAIYCGFEGNSNVENDDVEDDSYRSRNSQRAEQGEDVTDDTVEYARVSEQSPGSYHSHDGDRTCSQSGSLLGGGDGNEGCITDGDNSYRSKDDARVGEEVLDDGSHSRRSNPRSVRDRDCVDGGASFNKSRESSFSLGHSCDSHRSYERDENLKPDDNDAGKDTGSGNLSDNDGSPLRNCGSSSRHDEEDGLSHNSLSHTNNDSTCYHGEGDTNVDTASHSAELHNHRNQGGFEVSSPLVLNAEEDCDFGGEGLHPFAVSNQVDHCRDTGDTSFSSRLSPSPGNEASDDNSYYRSTQISYGAGEDSHVLSTNGDGIGSLDSDNVPIPGDIDGHESQLSMESEGNDADRPSLQKHLRASQESVSSMGETSITLDDLVSPLHSSPTRQASPTRSPYKSQQNCAPAPLPSPSESAHDEPVEINESDHSASDHSRISGTSREHRAYDDPQGGEDSSRHSEGNFVANERQCNESQASGYDSRCSSEGISTSNEHPGEYNESQASGYNSQYSDDMSERSEGEDDSDSRASGYETGGEPHSEDGDSQVSEYSSRRSSSERSKQIDASDSSQNSVERYQAVGADGIRRTISQGYSDSEYSNHASRQTRAYSHGSFEAGTFVSGDSQDIVSLTSGSSHSLRARNLAAPGMGLSSHHDTSSEEQPQYEFDLEKVIAEPSERRRGIRRKISFTQSFSSVNSDDSNVFGLSKLVRRRGGKRTNSMRLAPVPRSSNQSNDATGLSAHLSQAEHADQVPMSFDFEGDDVSRLGDSFGVSNANFGLEASIADLGESFANVNSYSYQSNPLTGSHVALSPSCERGAADPESNEERGRREDDSESTLSGASGKEEFGTDDAQSLSYRSDEDFEDKFDGPDVSHNQEIIDEPASECSNSSVSQCESAAAFVPSVNSGDKLTEKVSDGNHALLIEYPHGNDATAEATNAPSSPKAQSRIHPVSTSASADTTAPLSDSFSSIEDERSIRSPPCDNGEECLAKALQFLSSDLESPKPIVERGATPVASSTQSLKPDVEHETPPFGPDDECDDAKEEPSYVSSESEADSDNGSDTDDSNCPAKLVIKEAPLLRLENVTAQTRSSIPESKLKNKSLGAGNGGWGWSLFGKKAARPPPGSIAELPKGSSHSHSEEPGLIKTSASTSPQEGSPMKTMPLAPENQCKVDVAPSLSSDPAASLSLGNSHAPPPNISSTQRDAWKSPDLDVVPEQFKPETKVINVPLPRREGTDASAKQEAAAPARSNDAPVSSPEPRIRNTPAVKTTVNQHAINETTSSGAVVGPGMSSDEDIHSMSSSLPATQHVSSVAPPSQSTPFARASRLLSASVESPPAKKNRTKKSKDKKELTGHIERRRRKTNRHGDEVSVGTMNFQPHLTGSQFVVPNLFDEVSAVVEKRPWEKALAMRKAQKMTHGSLIEGLDFMVDPTHEKETENVLAPICTENSSVEKEADKQLTDVPDANAPPLADEDKLGDASDKGEDDSDELLSLHGLQELEMKYEDERKEVDFDDMWNNVDCDSKTKLEFEERKRGKEREKERKRIQREKARAAKRSKATRRLRLFEKHELELGYTVNQSAALSSEFLSALQRVFNEDAADEVGSGSDDEQSTVATATDGTLLRSGGSVMSLYLTSDKPVPKAANEAPTDSEDDDPSNAEMDGSILISRSRRATGKKLRRKGNTSRSSRAAPRSRKPLVDPATIFEAELKRQQRVKAMSVSNLRQEMSDRRGTSVHLIQKEFTERRYKRGSNTFQNQVAGASPQKQRHFSEGGDHSDPFASDPLVSASSSPWRRSPRRLVGGRTASPSKKIASAGTAHSSRDLSNHLSRWDVGGTVTELDDLMTVQMSPLKANFLTVATDLAANAASHLPSVPDLPPMPNLAVPGMPNLPSMPGMPNLPSMPGMPNLPSMPGMPNMPGIQNLSGAVSTIPSAVTTNYGGFAATFADMPLSTIDERADDDENEAGLLDGGWDDEDHPRQGGSGTGGDGGVGGGGLGARSGSSSPLRNLYGAGAGSGRFSMSSMKVPKGPASVASAAGKGLVKLKSMARLVPKLSIRGPGDGSGRQMTMLDDDDRGLLG